MHTDVLENELTVTEQVGPLFQWRLFIHIFIYSFLEVNTFVTVGVVAQWEVIALFHLLSVLSM